MNFKRLLFACLFAFIAFSVMAKFPKNLLSTNIGVVYFEFKFNENADNEMAHLVGLFGESGFNIVAAHNVSTQYNYEIAKYDMEAKGVEYVLQILDKAPAFNFRIVRLEDLEQKLSGNSIIRVAARTIGGIHNKTVKKLNRYQRKNPIENTPNLLSHYVDTLIFKDHHLDRVNYLIDKMNIADYLTGYDYEGLPEDLKTSKIAFVQFDNMDMNLWSNSINSIVRTGLNRYQYDYEIISNYDDYLKRKDEFKYRILFTSHNLVFSQERRYYRESRNRGSSNHQEHYKTRTQHVDKQLFSIVLRDEETGEIYLCTDHDWMHKSIREFVNSTTE